MFPIKDTIPSRRRPIMTVVLIAVNIYFFLMQAALPESQLGQFVQQFGFVPIRFSQIIRNQPWLLAAYYPLATGLFLHGGLFHLVSNMWALWIFGDNVEDLMGHWRFLLFYLVTGIIANIAHYSFNPLSSIPAVGASGAIAGVMGAYFIRYPFAKITTLVLLFFIPLFIDIPALIYLLIWLLSQLYSGTVHLLVDGSLAGGVAWWAHVGGFLAGMFLHKFFLERRGI